MERENRPAKTLNIDRLQLAIAILLAVAALLAAVATWMNQLHSSNMSAHYASASRLTAEATETYTLKSIEYSNDMAFWNEVRTLNGQMQYYKKAGDTLAASAAQSQIDALLSTYDETFAKLCKDALKKGGNATPFDEGGMEVYFKEANELNEKAVESRAAGDWDNLLSDSFALAQVFYSVVLFLLGLAGAWNHSKSKQILLWASVIMLVIGFGYMIMLPLPTDFNFLDYWSNLRFRMAGL